MSRLRVLTLGWEFPPLINGGLGVACLGLSRALARHVDQEVIVPRSDPAATYDGFALRGVNNLEVGDLVAAEDRYSYESFSQVSRIPATLDPYATGTTILETLPPETAQWKKFSETTAAQFGMFRAGGLYGDDLGVKVVEFSKIAAKLALQRDFDIIHVHDWMTFLAGAEVKKATGKPLVVHVHASQYDRAGAQARGWIYDLEKYGMEEADRVISVSHYTGKILTSHYLVAPDKIRPIHNGADPVDSFTTHKKFPEKLVLFLGRLTAQKGPEYFIEIASKVSRILPDVRFVMAGSGEKARQLVEGGAYRGLGGKFHFTGFLDTAKVRELLSMTDVYCMPSVSEPFGLSALEAAQFRIPAVISRQSGVAEVLRGALKADFWDTDLMARHIVNLLTDPQLRERVLDQGSKDVAAATWDASAQKVLEVYRELVP